MPVAVVAASIAVLLLVRRHVEVALATIMEQDTRLMITKAAAVVAVLAGMHWAAMAAPAS
jgi:hypothetical protein